jgi:hypothetical protein
MIGPINRGLNKYRVYVVTEEPQERGKLVYMSHEDVLPEYLIYFEHLNPYILRPIDGLYLIGRSR